MKKLFFFIILFALCSFSLYTQTSIEITILRSDSAIAKILDKEGKPQKWSDVKDKNAINIKPFIDSTKKINSISINFIDQNNINNSKTILLEKDKSSSVNLANITNLQIIVNESIQADVITEKFLPTPPTTNSSIGIPYYDALALANGKNIKAILKHYKYTPKDANNTYLQTLDIPAELESSPSITTIGNYLGQLDVTKYADALTSIVIDRFKEELNATFFKRLNDDLDTIAGLGIMFPQTKETLGTIGNDIYKTNLYIETLRASFKEDLEHLFVQFPVFLKDPDVIKQYKLNPELNKILSFSNYLAENLIQGTHPGEILKNMPLDDLPDDKNKITEKYMKPSLQFMKALSESIRSKNPNTYWVPKDSLQLLLNNSKAFDYFLGLLIQKTDTEDIKINGNKISAIINSKTETEKLIYQYYQIIIHIDNDIKKMDNDKMDKSDFTLYLDHFSQLLATQEKIIEQFGGNIDALILQKIKNTHIVIRNSSDITRHVLTKEYNLLAIDITQSLQFLNATVCKDNPKDSFCEFTSTFLKYTTFAAALINAKDKDDVKDIISATILPPGSSAIKQNAHFSIAINSYIGAYGGWDFKKGYRSYGMTLPIGPSFNWGIPNCPVVKSVGFFVPLVDLGGIANFRIKNDSTELPAIKLQNIVSPGLQISLGRWFNTPITLNGGIQLGPQLVNILDKDGSLTLIKKEKNWRFSIGLVWDIPLWNISAK